MERAIASAPTPTKNARDAPECLPEKPSMILAIPLIRNATAINMIIIRAVVAGYEMAKPAKIKTSTPRPMFAHLDLPGEKIPTKISSIPTKNKTIANIKIIEM